MMFYVMVKGAGFKLRVEDDAAFDAGFYKNEFVVARSREDACKKAMRRVRACVEEVAEGGGLVLGELTLDVDHVERSFRLWNLVRDQGFIFFPVQ